MNISIILPAFYSFPIGGYKVQYEYANRLQARGHTVTIIFPQLIVNPVSWKRSLSKLRWVYRMRCRRPLVDWFPLDPNVRITLTTDLSARYIPPADAVIATSWMTAEMVRHYPPSKGAQFYMVYDYEYWVTADDETRLRMADTYRAGMHMICTSPAVQEMLSQNDAVPAAYIPCGLDFSVYGLDNPIDDRVWGTIGFPVRPESFKGTADAVDAMRLLKQRHGERLQIEAFGSSEGKSLPDWIRYRPRLSDAKLRAFYNGLSIFVFPSHYEGWGLTGVEALACGSALVASDSVGLRDYARNGETALLVPPKRPDLLASAVDRFLQDDMLRRRLALRGHQQAQQYQWERAVNDFEEVLTKHATHGVMSD